jgi:hypothetical protein
MRLKSALPRKRRAQRQAKENTVVDSALLPAIREALRQNEIGDASPYVLSYARLGVSGASFGVFQGDTHVDPDARATLRKALQAAGADGQTCDRIIAAVTPPCPDGSPLSKADQQLADAALSSPAGRTIVDAMDDRTLAVILRELDSSIGAAAVQGFSIEPRAQLDIALWVNMTGEPGVLNKWLEGETVGDLSPPLGPIVSRTDLDGYLKATKYFTLHPRNFVHFSASVDAGAKLLPRTAPPVTESSLQGAAIVAMAPTGAAAAAIPLSGSYWIYAQSTGRMYHFVNGGPVLLAKGYSGSSAGENNPDEQCVADHGPLPRGKYLIGAPQPLHRMKNCLRLYPDAGNAMCGRGGFFIHDGVFHGGPHGDTSHGCICLPEAARLTIWDSTDLALEVVRDDPPGAAP